jgi:hypothetical protein
MRNVRILTAVALASIAAGCAYRGGTPENNLVQGAQWTATVVQTTASAIHGTVTFVRTDPQNQTRVIFALRDGIANTVLPWHVHYGVCGNDHLIVGRPANYPPLVIDQSGQLRAVALLPVELTTQSTYVVHLHASPTEMHTVIACAPLVPQGTEARIAGTSR